MTVKVETDRLADGVFGRRPALVSRRSQTTRWAQAVATSRCDSPLKSSAGLAPEPRPATNTEPRLQSLVFFPVLPRCPDEKATDKNGGHEEHETENDRSRGVHPSKSFPRSGLSTPTKRPQMQPRRSPHGILFSGAKRVSLSNDFKTVRRRAVY